jgi:tRNA A-37 threonylcarbamoyl transferase component Bud32
MPLEYAETPIALPDELSTKYELLSEIGVGGMGVVYKARHRLTNKIVAIKLLRSDKATNPSVVLRFKQEAEAASKLAHPHVIIVHDFGVSEATAYLVMEFVDGKDLAQVIRTEEISFERFKSIFIQVCDGLAQAHHHGIVHRDLKPSNILISTRTGEKECAKIADFGIAKLLNDETTQHLTKTGEICGSPLYMSPEQCTGRPADFRSDIFSLGCMMYEAITRQVPNAGENTLETIHRRSTEQPRTFTECGVTFSGAIEKIVMRCLERNPADRYQSVDELRADLERGKVTSSPRASSSWILRAGIAAVATAIVMFGPTMMKQTELDQARSARKQAEALMENGNLVGARKMLIDDALKHLQKAPHDQAFKDERTTFIGVLTELKAKETGHDAVELAAGRTDKKMKAKPAPQTRGHGAKLENSMLGDGGSGFGGASFNALDALAPSTPAPQLMGNTRGRVSADSEIEQIKSALGND